MTGCWFSAVCVFALSVLLCVDPAFAQTGRADSRPATRPARARGPAGPILGELMDYGPFLSYSVLRPGASTATTNSPIPTEGHQAARTDGGELIAVRGITIHVGNNASVCFDTDLLSVAGGWTGGFLDLGRSNLKPGQGPL